MKQLGLLNFNAAPIAPQSVTMAPSARESRRSGLRVARTKMPTQLLEYLACLKALGPASDHEVARVLGWPLATTNARRHDAGAQVVAAGRMVKHHPNGKCTRRTLWKWVGPR